MKKSYNVELSEIVQSTVGWLSVYQDVGTLGFDLAKPREVKRGASDLKSIKKSPSSTEIQEPTTVQVQEASDKLPLGDRLVRLRTLSEETKVCKDCKLHENRKQAVFSRGNPLAEICFVGEGPGADEDEKGEPFVGRAGKLLDKMIVAMGFAREDVYICNIVKCRPPNNRKPEPEEMEACSHFFNGQIDLVQPKVIVALGATAVQGLLGTLEPISKLRGNWKLYRGKILVMPTYHPAYLLRQPSAKRDVWSDLQEVMKKIGKPLG